MSGQQEVEPRLTLCCTRKATPRASRRHTGNREPVQRRQCRRLWESWGYDTGGGWTRQQPPTAVEGKFTGPRVHLRGSVTSGVWLHSSELLSFFSCQVWIIVTDTQGLREELIQVPEAKGEGRTPPPTPHTPPSGPRMAAGPQALSPLFLHQREPRDQKRVAWTGATYPPPVLHPLLRRLPPCWPWLLKAACSPTPDKPQQAWQGSLLSSHGGSNGHCSSRPS